MILVNLMGGLGNQMFQYAFGLSVSHRTGAPLGMNCAFFESLNVSKGTTPRKYELGAFGIQAKVSPLRARLLVNLARAGDLVGFPWVYRFKRENCPYSYDPSLPPTRRLVLDGYFQSHKYFSEVEGVIRKQFTFREPQPVIADLIHRVRGAGESVAVLVRRDDYVALGSEFLLRPEYYRESLQVMRRKLSKPKFFVFTIGETDWARETFKNEGDVEIVENDRPGMHGAEKMRVMSLCRHAIIANSSFGWWAAWLNSNPSKIVIAPKAWLNKPKLNEQISISRIPPGWLQI